MFIDKIPQHLTKPGISSGKVVEKVMLDLTVYLSGPSETEFDFLLGLYKKLCPPEKIVRYKISELEYWPMVASPDLTKSGRSADKRGIKYPFFEPTRVRLNAGRAFEARLWDDQEIDDPESSWSFACRGILLRSTGLHSFVRFLLPLDTDVSVLKQVAIDISENVEFFSGHGGMVFVYDTWMKNAAFQHIYAHARRFWGIDIEDLNATLPLMKTSIKGISWTTLLGKNFISSAGLRIDQLLKINDVDIEENDFGIVITIGEKPVVGDQNRPDLSLNAYYKVAKILEPLFLQDHPDFYGERFVEQGNTVGWFRRFIEPTGWR